MDVDARIDALEGLIERQDARIAELEEALGASFVAPLGWGLTRQETQIFGVLLKRDLATKEALFAACYGVLHPDPPHPKIIDVFICKLRAKLRPVGLAIETIWGRGYRMTPEAKAQAEQLIAEGA